jgi:hypothetical protein
MSEFAPYTITLGGADIESTADESYATYTFRVLGLWKEVPTLYGDRIAWGGKLKSRQGSRDTLHVRFEMFTRETSDSDEGDLQRLRLWRARAYHWFVDSDAPWWQEWYPGYGEGNELLVVPGPLQTSVDPQYGKIDVLLDLQAAGRNLT